MTSRSALIRSPISSEPERVPLIGAPIVRAPIMIPGIAADGSLYPIEKMKAHREASFHLAISVFVFSKGALLLQRRALTKYHCGGLWANTVCTHPHWGESVEAAANRRLQEELGFDLPLQETRIVEYEADVGNGLFEHEKVHMFLGEADQNTIRITPNPEEVAEARWVTAEELHRELKQQPERFTPWFRIYVERYPDLRF
jgi:isopentenyl-diphosphate Delta-isomerase